MDWKRKLTSRKFWTAVAEFVTMLIIAFGGTQDTAVQVSAIVMAGAAVIAYIIGEGLVDAAASNYVDLIDEPPDDGATTGTLPSEGSDNV